MQGEISSTKAAQLLGVSRKDIDLLEKQELLRAVRKEGTESFFAEKDIKKIKSAKGLTIAQEAEEVRVRQQREISLSLISVKKILLLAGGSIAAYCLLVFCFALLFSFFPLQTADWLGYLPKTRAVLGASTSSAIEKPSALNSVFHPISRVSLGVIKFVNPHAYETIAKVTILDPNDVLTRDTLGAITPIQSVDIPTNTALRIATTGLIANLNSEYLQGRKPGPNIGDIAIVGEPQPNTTRNTASSPTQTIINTVTNTNTNIITKEKETITTITTADDDTNTSSPTGEISFADINDGTNTTAAMVVGSGGGLTFSGTGSINASQLNNATFEAPGAIGATIPNTGSFTTLEGLAITGNTFNGLTITSTGAKTLTIAPNKTFIANNSLTLDGLDGTTITFQGTDTYVGRSTTDALTNKSIAAGSNTISGLTNANLSGSAGITNANLANSSLTVSAGTGLSGGGIVSLGGAVSLANTGVLSLTGTSNQVNTSAASGNLTLSLPQNIHTGATPTFASLNLSNVANQLVLGTTNTGTVTWSPSASQTITLPDITDTLVGKTTIDVLTNKTLVNPIISGTMSGSGSAMLSNFASINGLTLTAATDGFTITGGTTPRTLTLTGASITLGPVIQPTSSGPLTVQSNGALPLALDTGGANTVSIGTTSATAINMGRSGVTTTINGTANINNLNIGNGTTITRHLSGTSTFDAANITVASCANIGTVTVTGAAVGDSVTASPTAVSGGIETLGITWNAFVSAADTVTIRACNILSVLGQNPPNQTWRADVWQH